MSETESIPGTISRPERRFDAEDAASRSARRQLEEQIAVLENSNFCWLRHSPSLEAYFETSTATLRSRRMWIEGIFCLVLFNCFLIPDYLFFRAHFSQFLLVRLCFATPPTILALVLLRRGISKTVRESMIVLICVIFALSILYLYFGVRPVVSAYAVTDIAILVLFANVGIRPRLPYAIVAATTCLAFGAIFLYLDTMLIGAEKFESLFILTAAVLLSVIGNYSIERGDRLNFLRRLQSDAEFGALATANDHLLLLTRQDRLTGLSNRRHFDEVYSSIWNDAVSRGSTLSVILIDIDNFKALNDHYGHLYGDAVLQRVGSLLKQSLRKEGDFVARYGGEEFVVVLPNSSGPVGLRVAERIRLLIEVAGSPAVAQVDTKKHGWGTVSCGLATGFPRKKMNRKDLINMADKALYQAKAQGRNRVCVADRAARIGDTV